MKRYAIAAKAALILLGIALSLSCSLMAPRTGSLTIPFPPQLLGRGGPGSRALTDDMAEGQSLSRVRVYLEAQGGLVPLGGKGFVFESDIPSDNTITIDGVPPIRNCVLYVALLTDVTNGVAPAPVFRIVKYVNSGIFSVVAGATTSVTLNPFDSPFKDLSTASSTAKGVRALELGGVIYILADGTLLWEGGPDGGLDIVGSKGIGAANSLGAGRVINSDGSLGADQVWVNTDMGIYALVGQALEALPVEDKDGLPRDIAAIGDILESGVIALSYTTTNDDDEIVAGSTNAILYQGKGKIGGAFSADEEWTWFDIADFLDDPQMESLKSSIEEATGKLVADYWIAEDGSFGYAVVPAINSLRIGGDIIDKAKNDLPDDPGIQDILDMFLKDSTIAVPKVNNIAPLIKSVSMAGSSLFVGTDQGVFTIEVDAADGKLAAETTQRVNLGRTVYVIRLRAKQFVVDGPVWTGVLAKSGTLFLLKDGELAATYPFYTGIPEFSGDAANTGDLFWTEEGLVVTGTSGAVRLGVDELTM